MDWLTDPTVWVGLATLVALEIVLGVDNLIFIAILAGRLPPESQERARRIGLSLALVMRLALLASISWVMSAAGAISISPATRLLPRTRCARASSSASQPPIDEPMTICGPEVLASNRLGVELHLQRRGADRGGHDARAARRLWSRLGARALCRLLGPGAAAGRPPPA